MKRFSDVVRQGTSESTESVLNKSFQKKQLFDLQYNHHMTLKLKLMMNLAASHRYLSAVRCLTKALYQQEIANVKIVGLQNGFLGKRFVAYFSIFCSKLKTQYYLK